MVRRAPGRVNVGGGELCKFRHPLAHIVAVGIEFPALEHGVEHAEIGGRVRAAARDPLPTRGIVGEVGIDERVPEPRCPLLPGEQKVLHQERGDDHARPVRHPAGLPQLAHGGIDDGIAGLAPLPGLERVSVAAPGKARELRPQGLRRHVGEAVEQMGGELAPAELAQEGLGAFAHLAACAFACVAHRMPHLVRADLAEMEMWRQARRGVVIEIAAVVGVCAKAGHR